MANGFEIARESSAQQSFMHFFLASHSHYYGMNLFRRTDLSARRVSIECIHIGYANSTFHNVCARLRSITSENASRRFSVVHSSTLNNVKHIKRQQRKNFIMHHFAFMGILCLLIFFYYASFFCLFASLFLAPPPAFIIYEKSLDFFSFFHFFHFLCLFAHTCEIGYTQCIDKIFIRFAYSLQESCIRLLIAITWEKFCMMLGFSFFGLRVLLFTLRIPLIWKQMKRLRRGD